MTSSVLGFSRPLRPRPSPDQTTNDQQPAPGENPEQGQVNLAEISQPPQTNGEVAEGQKQQQQQQQQRRQPRRRRQRNSESSTSKVRGCYVKVMGKSLLVAQPNLPSLFLVFRTIQKSPHQIPVPRLKHPNQVILNPHQNRHRPPQRLLRSHTHLR